MVVERPSSGGAREVVMLAQVCSEGQGGMEAVRTRARQKSRPAGDWARLLLVLGATLQLRATLWDHPAAWPTSGTARGCRGAVGPGTSPSGPSAGCGRAFRSGLQPRRLLLLLVSDWGWCPHPQNALDLAGSLHRCGPHGLPAAVSYTSSLQAIWRGISFA